MKRLAAVVSATNRRGTRAVCESLRRHLARNAELEIAVVSSSAEATDAAQQAAMRAEVVVAAGGDGTVADVATGIFGSHAAMGIVPGGSTNITARSLGIPTHLETAIALIAGPHRLRQIDVGRSQERSFLNIAGAGYDAEMFTAANLSWKRRAGWVAYLPAAAAALRRPPSEVRVTADGERIEARSPLVLVANGGSVIAPWFRLYPGIALDDGWLDLLVFTATTPAQIASAFADAARLRLHRSPYVKWRRARTIQIEARPPLSVQLDGDVRGSTPREFSVKARALNVITPAR